MHCSAAQAAASRLAAPRVRLEALLPGGGAETIPETWSQPKPKSWVITEGNLAEVFGNGAYTLTGAEAAKLLEELTGAHRTSCNRALRLNGRFARHLRVDGAMLSWR